MKKKNYYIKGANFKFKKIKFIIINLKVKNIKMTLPGEGFMTNWTSWKNSGMSHDQEGSIVTWQDVRVIVWYGKGQLKYKKG